MRDEKMKREAAAKTGGRVERGRGILLYQASTDFANSYFRDDCGKRNVKKSGSSSKIDIYDVTIYAVDDSHF